MVLVTAGGGSRAIAELLEVPGASRTVVEAVVPYAPVAMCRWLGAKPDEFCSSQTVRSLAVAAFRRACDYETSGVPLAGISCTASLASDRPKRGPHRAHIAAQTAATTAAWYLPLLKDRRTRAEEERLLGRLLLNVIAEVCRIPGRLPLELLEGEKLESEFFEAPEDWRKLFLGESPFVCCGSERTPPKCVLPGAFNPWHEGHQRMAELAGKMLSAPTVLELSIENMDKPPLDYLEIRRRLAQFPPEQTVYLTRAAAFEQKARLFPGATFVVGMDTLQRLVQPHYYGEDATARDRALRAIVGQGCHFLVFDRYVAGSLLRLKDLELPEELRAVCREVPPEVFCLDISSTTLRCQGNM